MPGGQPDRRHARRSALRQGPRGGHAVRASGVAASNAAADGARERRAAASLLHRAHRPGPVQGPARHAHLCRRATSRATRRSRPRRSRWPTPWPLRFASIPSSGTTSTDTGTRSATITAGSPDAGARWILVSARGVWPHAHRRRYLDTQLNGPLRACVVAAALGSLAPDLDAALMPFGWDRYLRAHEIGTHTIVGTLACALLTAAAVPSSARPASYWWLTLSAWIGAASHVLLDLVSGARLRPGWPLIDTPSVCPLVAMADPWLLALLRRRTGRALGRVARAGGARRARRSP